MNGGVLVTCVTLPGWLHLSLLYNTCALCSQINRLSLTAVQPMPGGVVAMCVRVKLLVTNFSPTELLNILLFGIEIHT